MPYDGSFLRQLFDLVSDGLCFVDRTGQITMWSRGATELTGFSAREVLGRRCWDHGNGEPLTSPPHGGPLRLSLQHGRSFALNASICHKRGHFFPVHISTLPVTDTHGELSGAAVIMRRLDPTEDRHVSHLDPLADLALLRTLARYAVASRPTLRMS